MSKKARQKQAATRATANSDSKSSCRQDQRCANERMNPDILHTIEELARRERQQQRKVYGANPALAVNTYLSQQSRGSTIDRTRQLESSPYIDEAL